MNDAHRDISPRQFDALCGGDCDAAMTVELLSRFPYFTLPAARLLRSGRVDDDNLRRRLTTAVAVACPDPRTLYMLLEPDGDAHRDFYHEEAAPAPSTNSVIDTFLDTYGSSTPEENAALERLIFNPTPDYAQLLAREEQESIPTAGEAPAGSQDDLLNRFILKQKESEGTIAAQHEPVIAPDTVEHRVATETPEAPSDDSLLSESLARVFIKQRRFDRAYEIISQLNLKYPEKSVYFADQLRFLRKLMATQQLAARK